MIKRKLEKKAIQALRVFPAVAILGPRQIGKTTLAKALLQLNKKNSLYLDLENPANLRQLDDAVAFFDENKTSKIILDEIQIKPELFQLLRSSIDLYRKNGRFILLGSASPLLIKGVSESLAGRIQYLELGGISITEITEKINMFKHWFRGGFPKALLASSDANANLWLDSFIRSYVERDLSIMFGVSFTPSLLLNFIKMLAYNQGNIWNGETYAKSLAVTIPTVNRYLDYLEAAFIIHKLPAFHINIGKRLVKTPKLFIRDSGIVHRLLEINKPSQLRAHPSVGGSWEGYVIEQIYQNKLPHHQCMYYRTHNGAECDLVITNGIHVLACIEIKLSESPTLSKGFYISCDDLKPLKKFVVTPGHYSSYTKDKIRICNLHDFTINFLHKI